MINVITIADSNFNLQQIVGQLSEAFPYIHLMALLTSEADENLLITGEPDLLILITADNQDIEFEKWKTLKSNPQIKLIPLLIVTTHIAQAKQFARDNQIKAEAFLSFPPENSELNTQVARLIQLKKSKEIDLAEKAHLEELIKIRTAALETELEARRETEKKLVLANLELEQHKLATLNLLEDLKTEIIERKTAEQELLKLSQVVQQSPDSIIITNASGVIEYANPATCLISGFSVSELVGKTAEAFAAIENSTLVFQEIYKELKSGNDWKGEFKNRKKNGDTYWQRASISPIKNAEGEITHFISLQEDITERKQGDIIQKILYNISKQVIETNDINHLLEVIKTELNELINTENFYVAFYNEQTGMLTTTFGSDKKDPISTWPAERSVTGYVIRENKSLLIRRNDFRKMIDDGVVDLIGVESEIWLGVPLQVDGKPYGAFVVQDYNNPDTYSDAELKMLEFIASQVGISIQRQKNMADLQEALIKAEAGDRLKTAFINNISHEIRTPLNGILGFSEMTLSPDSSPEDNELFFTIIKKSSKRLLNTITSYMDIAMIVSGTMETSSRPAQLSKICEDIRNDFIDICALKGIELQLFTPKTSEPLQMNTDQEKVRKIITHLLDNASKFTQKGYIHFGFQINEQDVEFYVKDTGTGIKAEAFNTIFEAFMQGDVSSTRGYEGSGLGLTIANGMVKLLGGKLWVESERGKGSTFYFTLPFAQNPVVLQRKPIETPVDQKIKKPVILIAEDDDSNYKYIEIVLLYAEYEVLRAENGIDAVDLCRTNNDIRLVLMDIKMPLMDGFEATRQIRAFKPQLPVVALTAHVTTEDENAAIAAGCTEYVTKPVTKTRLLEIIDNLLILNP